MDSEGTQENLGQCPGYVFPLYCCHAVFFFTMQVMLVSKGMNYNVLPLDSR